MTRIEDGLRQDAESLLVRKFLSKSGRKQVEDAANQLEDRVGPLIEAYANTMGTISEDTEESDFGGNLLDSDSPDFIYEGPIPNAKAIIDNCTEALRRCHETDNVINTFIAETKNTTDLPVVADLIHDFQSASDMVKIQAKMTLKQVLLITGDKVATTKEKAT